MLTLLCLLLLLSMGSGAAQPAAPLVPVPDPLAGGARVTLTWEPGANTVAAVLSGYRVYQSTQSGAYGAPRQQVPPTVTTATVEGLTPGATYFFVVTAVNTRGEESANSNEATITLPEPPVVPPVSPPSSQGRGCASTFWTTVPPQTTIPMMLRPFGGQSVKSWRQAAGR